MKNPVVCFVYSQMQVDEKKQVLQKIGRDFQCGEVSVGNSKVKFSDTVEVINLSAFKTAYPDAKIITKGIKSKMIYAKPTEKYIGSGKE